MVFSAIILFALGFIACEKSEELSGESSRMKAPSYDDKLAAEYNADFDQVAFAVNRLLEGSQEFRTIVHIEVGKEFDDDYNVLISQLIVNHNIVVELFALHEVDILSIVERYPLIQIAIPVEYEQWDGQGGLPVVFVTYEFDESKTEFVDGYDVNGKNVSFSTEEEPEFPVVVISENERTKVLDRLPTEPEVPQNLTANGTEDGIVLEWQQYSNENVIGYDIYRKGNSDAEYVQIASLTSSKSVNNAYSFVDVDANAIEEKYDYYVVATGNHTTGSFIITKSDIYTLVQNPKILYSASSNITRGDPILLPDINLKIYYHISNFLELKWSGGPPVVGIIYNVYRWRSDQPNNRVHIGSTTSNSYIDNATNLSKGYLYKYQVTTSSPTISSNFAYSQVSHRSKSQKVQIKECKFKDKEALQKVECWVRGKPDMRFRCCISNKNNTLVKNLLIVVDKKGKSRKDFYQSWVPVNVTFLKANEVNDLGSMVSFVLWEEDNKRGSKPLNATTAYEDHYRVRDISHYSYQLISDVFQTPVQKVIDVYKNDFIFINDAIHIPPFGAVDNYTHRTFMWWWIDIDENSRPYEDSYSLFNWRVKTIN